MSSPSGALLRCILSLPQRELFNLPYPLQHRHGLGHGADAPHQHGAAAEAARKTELEAQMSSAEDAEYEEVGDGETA